jgi:scyllo-inositol 2-dehydrogenase (NADP+)
MSLSVGVVGFGLAGRQFHCPLIRAAGMQVRGVVTRQAELVRQSLGDVRVHVEINSLLADTAIDLVVIATPNHLHAPQAMAALKAGKHVVIDKPFALNLGEVDALLQTAQAQRRCLAVFHNRRWDSDFLTLRKVLDAGRLGEIYRAQIRWDRYRPNVVERWREHEAAGGGMLLDLGPHLIDQALCLFGAPEWLQAELLQQRTGALVEDGFEIWMGRGALRIHIGCSAIAADNFGRYHIHGLLGSLSKGGLDVQEQQLRDGVDPVSDKFGIEPDEQSALLVDATGQRQHVSTERGNWVEFYRGMQRAIEEGAPVPVSGAEAREVMRVMDAVRISHLEQRRVRLR